MRDQPHVSQDRSWAGAQLGPQGCSSRQNPTTINSSKLSTRLKNNKLKTGTYFPAAKKQLSSTCCDRRGGRRANQDLTHIHSENRLCFCTESKKQTNRLKYCLFFFQHVHLNGKTILKGPSIQASQIVLKSSLTVHPSIYPNEFTAS